MKGENLPEGAVTTTLAGGYRLRSTFFVLFSPASTARERRRKITNWLTPPVLTDYGKPEPHWTWDEL